MVFEESLLHNNPLTRTTLDKAIKKARKQTAWTTLLRVVIRSVRIPYLIVFYSWNNDECEKSLKSRARVHDAIEKIEGEGGGRGLGGGSRKEGNPSHALPRQVGGQPTANILSPEPYCLVSCIAYVSCNRRANEHSTQQLFGLKDAKGRLYLLW